MDISENAPILIAQAAGFFLLAAVVWLLNARRIYIDAETKKPIVFELPLLGKLKSQNPVLVLVLIGTGLVLYPLTVSDKARSERISRLADQATVEGEVESDKPVTITVVPLPRFQATLQSSGPFKMSVPMLPDVNYRAWFSVDGYIATDQAFDLTASGAKLAKFTYAGVAARPPHIPKKEVSDADLERLGIR